MMSVKTSFLAVAAFALSVTAQNLTINSLPSLVECQPVLVEWSGGQPPYFLAVIPGGQPSAPAIENLPQQTGTSYTWTVNIAAGTSVTIKITDSFGDSNYNSQTTIQSGSETSCLSASPSGGSAGASGAAGSAAATGAPATSAAVVGGTQGSEGSSSAAAATQAGSSMSSASQASMSTASSASASSASASKSSATPVSSSGAALPMALKNKATGVVAILGAIAALVL